MVVFIICELPFSVSYFPLEMFVFFLLISINYFYIQISNLLQINNLHTCGILPTSSSSVGCVLPRLFDLLNEESQVLLAFDPKICMNVQIVTAHFGISKSTDYKPSHLSSVIWKPVRKKIDYFHLKAHFPRQGNKTNK